MPTVQKQFFFPAMGAAYGTAKSGTGIAAMAVMRPEAIMKSIIPVSTPYPNISQYTRQLFTPRCLAGGHGGYYRHLRGGRCRPHRRPACACWCGLRIHTLQVSAVSIFDYIKGPLCRSDQESSCLLFQGLRALGSGAFSWSLWSSGRLRHRHCW